MKTGPDYSLHETTGQKLENRNDLIRKPAGKNKEPSQTVQDLGLNVKLYCYIMPQYSAEVSTNRKK